MYEFKWLMWQTCFGSWPRGWITAWPVTILVDCSVAWGAWKHDALTCASQVGCKSCTFFAYQWQEDQSSWCDHLVVIFWVRWYQRSCTLVICTADSPYTDQGFAQQTSLMPQMRATNKKQSISTNRWFMRPTQLPATINRTLTHLVSHYIPKLIVPSSAKAQIRASWCDLHGIQLTYLTKSWSFVVYKMQSPLQ